MDNNLLRVTKVGTLANIILTEVSEVIPEKYAVIATIDNNANNYPAIVHDCLLNRVIFATSEEIFVNKLVLIDAIDHLTGGRFQTPLERVVQIDIDDMFVAASGTRIVKDDVDAMIQFQNKWQRNIPGLQLVIGFSGKFYQKDGNRSG